MRGDGRGSASATDYPKFRAPPAGTAPGNFFGPFGAAAAVGSLLKFDADTMARAFGLAGSPGGRHVCRMGHADGEIPSVPRRRYRDLMAALLAQQKFVATREFLTAKDGGLYNTYVDGGKPDLAAADLGNPLGA